MDLLNPIFISQDNFTTQAIYALHFWDLRFNNHILRVATSKRRSQSCRLNLLSICINGFSFLLSTANTECMNEVKWFTWHLNHIILLTYIIFIFLKYIEHRENAHHFYDSIHNLDQHHSLNLFLANVTQVTLNSVLVFSLFLKYIKFCFLGLTVTFLCHLLIFLLWLNSRYQIDCKFLCTIQLKPYFRFSFSAPLFLTPDICWPNRIFPFNQNQYQ